MQYIERIHYGFRRHELMQWGIADAATDAVIGTCTITHLSVTHERAEIGFALRQARWGQGLGSEAVAAVIDFAFNEVGLHRIEADVDPRDGERQDAVMMAVLQAEWQSRT